jgi:hypothetical protein
MLTRIFRILPALTLSALAFSGASARAETKAAASALFEYGKAYPLEHLADVLGDGDVYRFKLFGGVKIDTKWLGAVGLGVDFSYINHETLASAGAGSHYRRYQWDLLTLPLAVWLFVLEGGLTWNVTSTKLVALGIDETSIRPGLVGNLGFRLPIIPHLTLRADARYEYVFSDTEVTDAGDKFNIQGPSWSLLGGLEAYF